MSLFSCIPECESSGGRSADSGRVQTHNPQPREHGKSGDIRTPTSPRRPDHHLTSRTPMANPNTFQPLRNRRLPHKTRPIIGPDLVPMEKHPTEKQENFQCNKIDLLYLYYASLRSILCRSIISASVLLSQGGFIRKNLNENQTIHKSLKTNGPVPLS